MFLVKKHGKNYTLQLSRLGLELDPLLTLRCSVAQRQQGAALSEPHESRRALRNKLQKLCSYFLEPSTEIYCFKLNIKLGVLGRVHLTGNYIYEPDSNFFSYF